MHPEPEPCDALYAGQVGYVTLNMKQAAEGRVGDTMCGSEDTETLPGFIAPMPMVFAGIYPMDSSEYEQLDKVTWRSLCSVPVQVCAGC
jgi:translation elongation factor EF-4